MEISTETDHATTGGSTQHKKTSLLWKYTMEGGYQNGFISVFHLYEEMYSICTGNKWCSYYAQLYTDTERMMSQKYLWRF